MSKDPAILWYPDKWIGGTLLMTRYHKGAYMDVLMAQYANGHLTELEIKTVLGPCDENLWETVLKKKFQPDSDGKYFNEMLEDVIIKRRLFTNSRLNNLKGTPKREKFHRESHMKTHMSNININTNIIEDLYNSVVIFFDEDCRPKDKKQKDVWYDTLDKLIRIDGHSPEQIQNIIKRTRMDDFWKTNFLSVLKLRKKNKEGIMYFTVFEKKMNHEANFGNIKSGATPEQLAEVVSRHFGTGQ